MPSTNEKLNNALEADVRHTIDSSDLHSPENKERMRRRYLYGRGAGLPRLGATGPGHHSASAPALSAAHGGSSSSTVASARDGSQALAGPPRSKLREALGDNGTVISFASRPSDDCESYEHDTLYRLHGYSAGARDAERVFFGAAEKRHRAAIGAAHREPWYVGYVNSATKTDASPFAEAQRYGYAGVARERRFHTSRLAAADRTLDPTTPAFLASTRFVMTCCPIRIASLHH